MTFADDTTVRRTKGDEHLPYVFVQAALACSPDNPIMWALRERAKRSVVKWSVVRDFVRSRVSDDAARVRSRLEEATIMVVDPAAFLRSIDVQGSLGPKLLLSREVQSEPQYRPFLRQLSRRVGCLLLINSGAESVYSLLRSPLIGEGGFYDPMLTPGSAEVDLLDPLLIAEQTPNLNKLSRIALQTTALVAHEFDPNERTAIRPVVDALRWSTDMSQYNQARLETLARRSIVYDRGHEDSTAVASSLHQAARDRLNSSPLRWASPNELEPWAGEVRTGITSDEAELQMADVAAGWAADVLTERGALALLKMFRIVLFNGLPLDRATAEKLDSERRFHDRLIQGGRT